MAKTPILDLLAKMNRRDHLGHFRKANADVPTRLTAEMSLA